MKKKYFLLIITHYFWNKTARSNLINFETSECVWLGLLIIKKKTEFIRNTAYLQSLTVNNWHFKVSLIAKVMTPNNIPRGEFIVNK